MCQFNKKGAKEEAPTTETSGELPPPVIAWRLPETATAIAMDEGGKLGDALLSPAGSPTQVLAVDDHAGIADPEQVVPQVGVLGTLPGGELTGLLMGSGKKGL